MLRSDFYIASEHHSSALHAIKRLDPREFITHQWNTHFAFVPQESVQIAETLADALGAWRWSSEVDEEGNIVEIGFEGEKLGHDYILFEAIAPFVREGSSIQIAGEDGRIWRWFFSEGGLQEHEGEVIFRSVSGSSRG